MGTKRLDDEADMWDRFNLFVKGDKQDYFRIFFVAATRAALTSYDTKEIMSWKYFKDGKYARLLNYEIRFSRIKQHLADTIRSSVKYNNKSTSEAEDMA